jgi:hypothetical protein
VSSHSVFVCLCVTAVPLHLRDPYGARSRRLHLAAVWAGRAARWPARQRRGRNAQTRARAGRRPGARRTRTDNANSCTTRHAGTRSHAATQPCTTHTHARTHTRAHTHSRIHMRTPYAKKRVTVASLQGHHIAGTWACILPNQFQYTARAHNISCATTPLPSASETCWQRP